MEARDLKDLELLLDRLSFILGGKVVIQTGFELDGYAVGVYNSKGERIKEGYGPTIENCFYKITNPS